MTQEELEKLSISDVYYILMNEKEYYSAEELAMLEKRKRELDRKYDEEEYNKEIENRPEEFRCPKCDGINKSSGKECVFCGYRFKRNDYFNGKDIQEYNRSNAVLYIISFLFPKQPSAQYRTVRRAVFSRNNRPSISGGRDLRFYS